MELQHCLHGQREQRSVQHREQEPRLRAHGLLPKRSSKRHQGHDVGHDGEQVEVVNLYPVNPFAPCLNSSAYATLWR